ncbi:N-acetyl sugar amidotransferase [Thalassospira australica]|uniref:N-acetyl sugar amidotransferase n=1 Tax=Thalassospira australica TaxID=1528106 RepID=UPI0009DF29C8|nr:N-acetyl sugar amidotransferase [Thalassospira australica]
MSQKTCANCLMDTSDPDIFFNENGVCNHCIEAEIEIAKIRLSESESLKKLNGLAEKIKRDSIERPYDAVVGMSGGVDSSYVAWLAHTLGLRVLAVHFDNGWNSEIAVANIRSVVETCGFDLETYVINWPEFKDLQRSFIRAGVVDIEMLSDHAIMASMFELAKRHSIRYVLSGTNIATEHGMPRAWVWNKNDLTNIEAIHRKFGERRLKSFPRMGLVKSTIRRNFSVRYEFIEILNLANFRKDRAMEVLEAKTGWRYYGGKHYESVFTKFYQAYILPAKFNIDKRKVHLSALIRNGEITKSQASEELDSPLYSEDELRRDQAYVLKKLSFSKREFDDIMSEEPVAHSHYLTDAKVRSLLKSAAKKIRL